MWTVVFSSGGGSLSEVPSTVSALDLSSSQSPIDDTGDQQEPLSPLLRPGDRDPSMRHSVMGLVSSPGIKDFDAPF